MVEVPLMVVATVEVVAIEPAVVITVDRLCVVGSSTSTIFVEVPLTVTGTVVVRETLPDTIVVV